MNLLDLMVKIGVRDEASPAVDDVSQGIVNKLAGAAKTAAKALAGLWATKKVVDFGKAAFTAYSEFEQLAGGTEKIFDQLDQAKILDDANRAFVELNMSANEYLQSINTVGATFAQTMGDEKAYETARTGMQAISDFASGTGADLGLLNEKYKLITRSAGSYQSIADQFAGILPQTSSDFLAQAQAAGFLSDSYRSLTEVPVAEYQEAVTKMLEKGVADAGFAGNTLKESLSTISGSLAATKAAWQNLVLEFGKPDADIGARIADMFTAVFGENGEGGLMRNVLGEAKVIGGNMIKALTGAIGSAVSWLITNGPKQFQKGVQGLVDSLNNFIKNMKVNPPDLMKSLGKAFENTKDLRDSVTNAMTDIAETVREWWPDIAETASDLWDTVTTVISDNIGPIYDKLKEIAGKIADKIIEDWPIIQAKLLDVMGRFVTWLTGQLKEKVPALVSSALSKIGELVTKYGPKLFEMAGQMFGNIGVALAKYGPTVIANLLSMLGQLVVTVIKAIPKMLSAAGELIMAFLNGMKSRWPEIQGWLAQIPSMVLSAIGSLASTLLDKGIELLTGLWNGITEKWGELTEWLGNLGSNALDAIGDISSTLYNKGKEYLNGFWNGLKDIWASISEWITSKVTWANNQTNSAGAGGGFSGGGGGGYDGGGGRGGVFEANQAAMPTATARPSFVANIYLQYDAGADATDLVYGIADGLKLVLAGGMA